MTAPLVADLGFQQGYLVELLPGLPGAVSVAQFHRKGQRTFREGVVVRVTPTGGQAWVGNFQCGDGRLSGVYATPSPHAACVVAGGQGYVVPVQDPGAYQLVAAYPIGDVRSLLELGLILFADFTDIVAYDSRGCVWSTGRLSWDGLTITSVSPAGIVGKAWDAPAGREVSFVVDPRSGRPEGGATPPGSKSPHIGR